jgi:hypothetical protein
MKLISTSDAKIYLGKVDVEHDELITDIIDTISSRMESFLNRELKKQQYTEYFNGHDRTNFYLKAYPLDKIDWNTDGKTVANVTLSGSAPVSINVTSHGYSSDNSVVFKDVGGSTDLNGSIYVITVTDTNNFTLNGTDSSLFSTYTSGGTVCISTSNSTVITVAGSSSYTEDSDYYIWEDEGRIEFVAAHTSTLPKQVKITYTGGYSLSSGVLDVPDDLKRACKLQVAYEFKRRNDIGITAMTLPDGSITSMEVNEFLPEVRKILVHYRRQPGMK